MLVKDMHISNWLRNLHNLKISNMPTFVHNTTSQNLSGIQVLRKFFSVKK